MVNLLNTLLSGSSFLLCILVLANPMRVNQNANRWFGGFLLCICLLLNESGLIIICSKFVLTYFEKLINIACFLIPSLFYMSVHYFVKPNRSWSKTDFYLFIFPVLYVILEFFPTSLKEKSNPYAAVLSLSFIVLFIIHIVAGCVLSYFILKKHDRQILLVTSNLKNVDLKWLKNIVYGIIILLLFWCLDLLFTAGSASTLLLFVNLIGLVMIAFYALKQKEIYPVTQNQKEELDFIFEETDLPIIKQKKTIEDDELALLKIKLKQLFVDKKLYLDSELSLIKLSTEMNLSLKEISYVINTGFNENFCQFVNQFRIEEAKRRIVDPTQNHLNLLGIAFEVGFNSKSVFNTTFKKITGITPSQFKKSNK
jgi:AraC-like DNA-binding protein